MKKGTVFNIQRFCVNDGPGIRTTVFLKGCMLDCLWCHNPESKSSHPQLMLHPSRCLGCLECLTACEKGLHSFSEDGAHLIKRDACDACGKCAEVCVGALEICGREYTAEEVIAEVMKDATFYKTSGGGMTISGGEPFMQHEFALELLRLAKENGINTAIETSGYVKEEILKKFIPYVDVFLWDFKESDEELHKKFTGVSNAPIRRNLDILNKEGAAVVLRCPLIEGYNLREEHLINIGKTAEALSAVIRVEVEPYHPMGSSKCESLGCEYPLGDMGFLDDEIAKNAIKTISEHTTKLVKKA